MKLDKIKALTSLIKNAPSITVFTGAGISTESGISDYRSQGGLWNRFKPVTIQEFMADEGSQKLYWERKKHTYEQLKNAKPNSSHNFLVDLEKATERFTLVTQNIDGLHQDAGSLNVLEIHGTSRVVICLNCSYQETSETTYSKFLKDEEVPKCPKCQGLLKPNTISFGQQLNQEVLRKSFAAATDCDLMLVLGSTLIVEPAASIPKHAKESGAKLVIINKDSTPLDFMADLTFNENISDVLRKVILV